MVQFLVTCRPGAAFASPVLVLVVQGLHLQLIKEGFRITCGSANVPPPATSLHKCPTAKNHFVG